MLPFYSIIAWAVLIKLGSLRFVLCQENLLRLVESSVSSSINNIIKNPLSGLINSEPTIYNISHHLPDLNVKEIHSDLLSSALNDLEMIQSALLNNEGQLHKLIDPANIGQDFQMLQSFGPLILNDISGCSVPVVADAVNDLLPKNDILGILTRPSGAYGESLLKMIFGASTNSDSERDASSSATLTSGSHVSKNNLINNLAVDRPEEKIIPCHELWGNELKNTILKPYLGELNSPGGTLLDNIEGKIGGYYDNIQNVLINQASSFDTFMKSVIETFRSRLQAKEAAWSSVADILKDRTDLMTNLRLNLTGAALNNSRDSLINAIDYSRNTLSSIAGLEPLLYTWIESPISSSNSIINAATKPVTNIIGSAIVPASLGKEIQDLSTIDPRLIALFKHFSYPDSASVMLTMKTLLDEITTMGNTDTWDRFSAILKPYENLGQPLSLKLGIANACLNYLNSMRGTQHSLV